MNPKEHIGMELKRLDNEIQSTIAFYRAESGDELTLMQSWVVGFLYQSRGRDIYQKDIEAKFSIARSTATGILQLLEKKGYIVRKSVEQDARLKRLELTEKGNQCQENILCMMQSIEQRMREGISEEELQMFFRLIQKMRSNIEKNHCETDRRRDQC